MLGQQGQGLHANRLTAVPSSKRTVCVCFLCRASLWRCSRPWAFVLCSRLCAAPCAISENEPPAEISRRDLPPRSPAAISSNGCRLRTSGRQRIVSTCLRFPSLTRLWSCCSLSIFSAAFAFRIWDSLELFVCL